MDSGPNEQHRRSPLTLWHAAAAYHGGLAAARLEGSLGFKAVPELARTWLAARVLESDATTDALPGISGLDSPSAMVDAATGRTLRPLAGSVRVVQSIRAFLILSAVVGQGEDKHQTSCKQGHYSSESGHMCSSNRLT